MMVQAAKFKFGGLTILGAIVALIGLATSLLLLSNGSSNAAAFVTATIGPTVVVLLSLFQAQQNGQKADTAASKATVAANATTAVSDKVDAVHGLVSVNLNELRSIIGNAMLENVTPVASSPATGAPTTLPPSEATK